MLGLEWCWGFVCAYMLTTTFLLILMGKNGNHIAVSSTAGCKLFMHASCKNCDDLKVDPFPCAECVIAWFIPMPWGRGMLSLYAYTIVDVLFSTCTVALPAVQSGASNVRHLQFSGSQPAKYGATRPTRINKNAEWLSAIVGSLFAPTVL